MAVEEDHAVAYLKIVDDGKRSIIADSHLLCEDPELGTRGVGIVETEELIDKVVKAGRGIYLVTILS